MRRRLRSWGRRPIPRRRRTASCRSCRTPATVIPVNPKETEILGERSYPSLVDVPERIDIVDVFRRAEDTPGIADEAVTIGAKALWLQTGIVSEDAAARAAAGGLTIVMDACIGAAHSRLRVPQKPAHG